MKEIQHQLNPLIILKKDCNFSAIMYVEEYKANSVTLTALGVQKNQNELEH